MCRDGLGRWTLTASARATERRPARRSSVLGARHELDGFDVTSAGQLASRTVELRLGALL